MLTCVFVIGLALEDWDVCFSKSPRAPVLALPFPLLEGSHLQGRIEIERSLELHSVCVEREESLIYAALSLETVQLAGGGGWLGPSKGVAVRLTLDMTLDCSHAEDPGRLS